MYVGGNDDDDFIGVVFSFQSSNEFYLLSWKRGDQPTLSDMPFRGVNYPGLQLKVGNMEMCTHSLALWRLQW